MKLLVPFVLAPALAAQVSTETVQQQVDDYFAPLVASGLFSGTVLVARDGEILVEKAFGRADIANDVANTTTTKFKLMSVSKSITAVALMKLVQDGALRLDDPVSKHLPSWPKAWSGVKVHDLLDHTSGIPNLCPRGWSAVHYRNHSRGLALWRAFAPQCEDVELMTKPGTQHRYSNFNFELAGAVLEAVSGKDYREVVRDNVLAPAGMTATGFDDGSRREGLAIGYFRENGAPDQSRQDMSGIQAAGGIYSTVGDLYRFDRALHGDDIVDATIKATMFTPKLGTYACGWQNRPVHDHPCVHHSGGSNGYVADFLRFVDDDACVVVQSNFAFAPITRLSNDVAAILFGEDYAQPIAIDPDKLDDHVGTFRGHPGNDTILIRRSGKQLMMFWLRKGHRQSGRVMIPVAGNAFALALGNSQLRFTDDGLEYSFAAGTRRFQRVDNGAEAWRKVAGDYLGEPQLSVRFRADDHGIAMQTKGRFERTMNLVTISATEAIALYSDGGGTMLRRDGETLRWRSPAGVDYQLRRK